MPRVCVIPVLVDIVHAPRRVETRAGDVNAKSTVGCSTQRELTTEQFLRDPTMASGARMALRRCLLWRPRAAKVLLKAPLAEFELPELSSQDLAS